MNREFSERPFIQTTWAPKGRTPVIASTGSWKTMSLSGIITATALGNRPKFFLRSIPGSMKAKDVMQFIKELKKHLSGKKLLLFWDGLPAHRAKIVQHYLKKQKCWLRAERFPAYAPELNPIEYLWASMKRKDLANHPPSGLTHLKLAIGKSRRRLSNSALLRGFLRASRLY